MAPPERPNSVDFLISYSAADRYWGEWIAWQLEVENDYTVYLQAWNFRPGLDAVQELQEAATLARRTIIVLSPQYLNELQKHPAWSSAFARTLEGEKGSLLPVIVRACKPKGLLAPIIPINLVGLSEEEARKALVNGIKLEKTRPAIAPAFPGAVQAEVEAPGAQGPQKTSRVLEHRPEYPQGRPPVTRSVEVFYAYAEKDEEFCHKLEEHLSTLQRQGLMTGWGKWKTMPGRDREYELETRLKQAQVILVLISADFLHSDDCYTMGVRALERRAAGEACAIPIILRPCDWENTVFGKFSPLPKGGLPVTRWSNRDDAFADIAQGIRKVIDDFLT